MNIIARTCLAVGFLWLAGIQAIHVMGADFRAVMREQQEAYAWNETCYSKEEVYKRVLATAETAHNQSPNVIWPSLLMLLGGIAALRHAKAPATEGQNRGAA